MSNFIFEIAEWKALNPAINCIISSVTLGYIVRFHPNICSFSIIFTFWIVD